MPRSRSAPSAHRSSRASCARPCRVSVPPCSSVLRADAGDSDEAPEKGEEWSVISKDYDEIILPGITHWCVARQVLVYVLR